MPRPKNLAKLLATLSEAEIDQLRELVKENPEVTELKKKKAALLQEVEGIDARIAELTGTKRGRKPGRKPGKAVSNPVGATKAPKVAKGRKPTTKPAIVNGEAAPAKRGRKPMTEEQRAAAAERLKLARAAKAAKQGSATEAPAPKPKREKKVKRVIVMNDLIKPKPKA